MQLKCGYIECPVNFKVMQIRRNLQLSFLPFSLSIILSNNSSLWWTITATAITKRNTVKKEHLTNKKVLLTYKKDFLPYKQDLFNIQKRIHLQIQKIHCKFLRKIPAANFHGKFLRQILAANSHGKFLRQIVTANSRICDAENGVVYPLCGRASRLKIKRKQVIKQKFLKA